MLCLEVLSLSPTRRLWLFPWRESGISLSRAILPSGGFGFKAREEKALRFMKRMQRRAAVIIAGAFRTVSGDALDIELFPMPVKETLDLALNSTLLRAASSPIYQ